MPTVPSAKKSSVAHKPSSHKLSVAQKISVAAKSGLKSGVSTGESNESSKVEDELENLLSTADLEEMCTALQAEGNGYDNRLSLDKVQLREFLSIVIRKGTEEQYDEFFDKVDATKLGKIDWFRIADHIFSEFEGKDDKNKQTTVPNWRPKRELQQNPHRDTIQRVMFWDKLKKYITVSKEGVFALWNDHNCELNAVKKLIPDSIKQRDLWVTDCVLMHGLGKIAVSNTCKEICIYELNTKLEFPCLYRIHNLKSIPFSLHFWSQPSDPNISILTIGDTKGKIVCFNFQQSTITLFERPPKVAGEETEQTLQIDFQEVESKGFPYEKDKENRTCWLSYHHWHQPEIVKRHLQDQAKKLNEENDDSNIAVANINNKTGKQLVEPVRKKANSAASSVLRNHRETTEVFEVDPRKPIIEQDIWARQVMYIASLDCIISCTTTTESSLVLAWRKPGLMRYVPALKLSGGVHAFDFNEETNIIGIACVDRNVYLYNPFVMSKPAGVLRGHMAAVLQVQFNKRRNHIISFSKDKVLRVWDVAQQISLQRIAGLHNSTAVDISSRLFFHTERSRLFLAIDAALSLMALKPEVKNTVTSHEKGVTCARFLDHHQVISSDMGGNVYLWRIDTGKRSKKFVALHAGMDISCLALNEEATRFFTGSSDGTVKEWDVAGNSRKTFFVDTEDSNESTTQSSKSNDQNQSSNKGAVSRGPITKRKVVRSHRTPRPADVLSVILLKREIVAVGWERKVCMFRPGEVEDGSIGTRVEWKGGTVHSEDIVAAAFASPITLATGSLDGEIVIWNMNSQSPSKFLTARKRMPPPTTSSGHDNDHHHRHHSHNQTHSRPDSNMTGHDHHDRRHSEEESDDYAVSSLVFVESRMTNKKHLAAGLANLISCGAGGWVRFWSSVTGKVCAEFCAHPDVTSITMRLDTEDYSRLVTADTDGYLKVWNIEEYCTDYNESFINYEPECVSEWQAHEDAITSVDLMRYQSEDVWLILSSSTDLTINLWMIDGTHIGTFGQDSAWKIKKFNPLDFPEEDNNNQQNETDGQKDANEDGENLSDSEDDKSLSRLSDSQIVDLLKKYIKIVDESDAGGDIAKERFNIWKSSELGSQYCEDRSSKRERKQPTFQRDFPYLYADALGKPAFGPHYSLDTPELEDTTQMTPEKPKSITDDSLMRSQSAAVGDQHRPPLDISEPPKHMFDEKNFFPRSILQKEHEARMLKAQEERYRRGTIFFAQKNSLGMPPTNNNSNKVSRKPSSIYSKR